MTITFRPAKRENVPLLLGFAGGTGSGKTYSALLVARGLAAGKPFVGIDTENGRMNHYADLFPELMVARIDAPFRPAKYTEAIEAADKFLEQQNIPAENRVIIVDSASHEWYGDGGCLDWQEELMGGQESRRLMSWIEPKKEHKRMVTRLLRVNAHVILCFRAEPKVEMVDDPERPGKKKFVEKRSLTGLHGWIPIAEKNLPYELTASFLLMADRPGLPQPIKLQEQHKPLVALDRPVDERTGAALAAWAHGVSPEEPPDAASSTDTGEAEGGAAGSSPAGEAAGAEGTAAHAFGELNGFSEEELAAAQAAAGFVVHLAANAKVRWPDGKTLAQINAHEGAEAFFKFALGPTSGDALRDAARAYCAVKRPALLEADQVPA